ncbi:MAG: putative toxin-antitoxin system toxin component, PIN family [Candidatus Daviesbacteria bacterium]|nr:putative toxin-antitoxin system toxin component, PIN family [Candidatus Daviesbacteria bacterium]
MIRAVLDTNTLVSAVINVASSVAAEIYQNCKEKQFLLIISPAILAEVDDVLHRDRVMKSHRRSIQELQELIKELADISLLVPGNIIIEIVRDSDDNKIIAAALEGQADYIVSRDKDLLDLRQHRGIKIISPENFMAILRSQR